MTFLYGITLVLHFQVSWVKFRCYHLNFWYDAHNGNTYSPNLRPNTVTGIWSFRMTTVIGRK